MSEFIDRNRDHLNPSQRFALKGVASMSEPDFQLIQGPPGTGKTHTIVGLLSMLVHCGVNRVLVCAPSNTAVDEIVERVADKQLFDGKKRKNPDGLLLRVGALGYDAPDKVLRHTLD